jgi:hypothetical protein
MEVGVDDRWVGLEKMLGHMCDCWERRGVGVTGRSRACTISSVSGWVARRARVAAHARAWYAGRASPVSVVSGSCRGWAGPKLCAFTTGNSNVAVSRFLTAKSGPLTAKSFHETKLCRGPSLVPTMHICRVDYVAHSKLICKQIKKEKRSS